MNTAVIFGAMALTIFQINCTQNLYKFTPEHCEITEINRSLLTNVNYKCFKTNRTALFLNLSFSLNMDILSDQTGQVLITGYWFKSNEYRKGPIEFMLGLCHVYTMREYDAPNIFANSNLKCPLQKGHKYYVYHVSPNASNMPPFIPEGRWRLDLKFMYMNKYTLFNVNWYTGVEYFIRMK